MKTTLLMTPFLLAPLLGAAQKEAQKGAQQQAQQPGQTGANSEPFKLEGTVLRHDKRPFGGAHVRVWSLTNRKRGVWLNRAADLIADEHGTFDLELHNDRAYRVTLVDPCPSEDPYEPWSPAVELAEAYAASRLRPEDEGGGMSTLPVQVTLECPLPCRPIAGRIAFAGGKALVNAEVSVLRSDRSVLWRGTTDANGSFEAPVHFGYPAQLRVRKRANGRSLGPFLADLNGGKSKSWTVPEGALRITGLPADRSWRATLVRPGDEHCSRSDDRVSASGVSIERPRDVRGDGRPRSIVLEGLDAGPASLVLDGPLGETLVHAVTIASDAPTDVAFEEPSSMRFRVLTLDAELPNKTPARARVTNLMWARRGIQFDATNLAQEGEANVYAQDAGKAGVGRGPLFAGELAEIDVVVAPSASLTLLPTLAGRPVMAAVDLRHELGFIFRGTPMHALDDPDARPIYRQTGLPSGEYQVIYKGRVLETIHVAEGSDLEIDYPLDEKSIFRVR